MASFLRSLPDRPFLTVFLYFVLTLLLLLPATATIPLMDRDEPRFAQATREMHETGQWVIPYFNGEYRFDKPPLTYWWMRLHHALLGETELASRLHSIFATWLTASFVYRLGRFLFSARAGFLAGLGWLTCFQVLVHGRLCVADLPMVFAVVVVMDSCARLLFAESPPRRWGPDFWLLVAGLAIGFLAKGPVAWAVPFLALLLMRWPFARVPVPWRRLQPVAAVIIALAIVSIWGVTALRQTNGAYGKVGIGEHVVHRGLAALNGRLNVPGIYYLATALISLLPWSPLGGSVFLSGLPLSGDLRRSFLMGWFVAPFLIFAFYATQLPHYIMPGFAAFFLLLFREGGLPRLTTAGQKIWASVVLSVAGLITALLVGSALLPWPEPISYLVPSLRGVAGIMILLAVFLPLALRYARSSRTRWYATAGAYAGAALLLVPVATNLKHHHPANLLRALVGPGVPGGISLVGCGFTEPSLVFYVNGAEPWKFCNRLSNLDPLLPKTGEEAVLVLMLREWQLGKVAQQWFRREEIMPLRDDAKSVAAFLDTLDPATISVTSITGYNVARSTWVELKVVDSSQKISAAEAIGPP